MTNSVKLVTSCFANESHLIIKCYSFKIPQTTLKLEGQLEDSFIGYTVLVS